MSFTDRTSSNHRAIRHDWDAGDHAGGMSLSHPALSIVEPAEEHLKDD
jgi:hypothetical protein